MAIITTNPYGQQQNQFSIGDMIQLARMKQQMQGNPTPETPTTPTAPVQDTATNPQVEEQTTPESTTEQSGGNGLFGNSFINNLIGGTLGGMILNALSRK